MTTILTTLVEVFLEERVVFQIIPNTELPEDTIVTPGHSQLFVLEEGQTVDLEEPVVIWNNVAIPSNIAFRRALNLLDEYLKESKLPNQASYIRRMKDSGELSEYDGFRKNLNLNLAAFVIAAHCQHICMQKDRAKKAGNPLQEYATRPTHNAQDPSIFGEWSQHNAKQPQERTF